MFLIFTEIMLSLWLFNFKIILKKSFIITIIYNKYTRTHMKTALLIILFIVISFVIYLFILGVNSKSKDVPNFINGHLSKCPETPNCFSTENKNHTGHYISPINISEENKSNSDSLLILKEIIQSMGGEIKTEKEHYFSSTFTSNIFGFVDDLEIRIDNIESVIHIRSASRVGRSDMGVNKKRIELIKQLYKSKING